eukprot:3687011-Rhodomonas_salina.3
MVLSPQLCGPELAYAATALPVQLRRTDLAYTATRHEQRLRWPHAPPGLRPTPLPDPHTAPTRSMIALAVPWR